jgi:hypothetical protein
MMSSDDGYGIFNSRNFVITYININIRNGPVSYGLSVPTWLFQ